MLREASDWDEHFFGGFSELFVAAVGTLRASVALGWRKFGFIDRMPFLFAQLGHKEGSRDRIRAQVLEAPWSAHHRVTLDFVHPDGDLVDAVNGNDERF